MQGNRPAVNHYTVEQCYLAYSIRYLPAFVPSPKTKDFQGTLFAKMIGGFNWKCTVTDLLQRHWLLQQ